MEDCDKQSLSNKSISLKELVLMYVIKKLTNDLETKTDYTRWFDYTKLPNELLHEIQNGFACYASNFAWKNLPHTFKNIEGEAALKDYYNSDPRLVDLLDLAKSIEGVDKARIIKISSDHAILATGSDKEVNIWRLIQHDKIFNIECYNLQALELTTDGKLLLLINSGNHFFEPHQVEVWDIVKKERLNCFSIEPCNMSIKLSSDDKIFYIPEGSYSWGTRSFELHYLSLVDASTGERLKKIDCRKFKLNNFSISKNNNSIMFFDNDSNREIKISLDLGKDLKETLRKLKKPEEKSNCILA